MPDSIIKADNISSLSGGGVGFPDGSVSNPSIKFTNDGDTGLYRIDANKIGIATNGSRVGEIGSGYGGFTGNVIQMLSSSSDTSISNTSNSTWAETGLNCSITPRYTNSSIFIIISLAQYLLNANVGTDVRISRGATPIVTFGYTTYVVDLKNTGINWEDTPNTISNLTYSVQFKLGGSASGTTRVNHRDGGGIQRSNIILIEVQK